MQTQPKLMVDGAGRWKPPRGRVRVAAPASGGRILASTEEGAHSYDPDYLLVHQLAYRLEGYDRWLILSQVTSHQHYLQGKRHPDGRYYLEYRSGSAAAHFSAYPDEWHSFVRAFFLYAAGADGWRQDLSWRRLALQA